jgi:hypothetical protein
MQAGGFHCFRKKAVTTVFRLSQLTEKTNSVSSARQTTRVRSLVVAIVTFYQSRTGDRFGRRTGGTDALHMQTLGQLV